MGNTEQHHNKIIAESLEIIKSAEDSMLSHDDESVRRQENQLLKLFKNSIELNVLALQKIEAIEAKIKPVEGISLLNRHKDKLWWIATALIALGIMINKLNG